MQHRAGFVGARLKSCIDDGDGKGEGKEDGGEGHL